MKTITSQQLETELKKKLDSAYLLIGADEFLFSNCIQLIKQKCCFSNEMMNFITLDDEKLSASKLLTELESMPFGADRRLILVRDADFCESDKKDIIKYFENPNVYSTLILWGNEKFGFLNKFSTIVECNKLKNYELQKIIDTWLLPYNKTASIEVKNRLIELSSFSLGKIWNECKKLCDFVGIRKEIMMEDIELLVPKSLEANVFELSTYIFKKKYENAISTLNTLLKNNAPQSILATIISTFRRMFLSSLSKDTDAELSLLLKVKPFAITIARDQIQSFSQKKLKLINELLAEVEYGFKSGQISADTALYYFIFSVKEII
ncbi:MAG: DNA polymerase III subunit delta [Clostridia bacterium]